MACGGRVYKGDTVTISVPFDVDDYSNLTITYTTIGDEKIVKTQQEVEIEDGFITYTFEPGELDLLPDGVIYYTIECDVNGVPNVDSTNTNLYLKTPAGYSGKTAEDYYQEGYEAGLEDCSGSTDCSSAVTEAYQSGVTEGMAEQKALLVSSAFTRNGTYTRENGWNEIEVDVPHFLPAEEKTLRLVQHVPGPWEVVASYPIGMSKVTVEDDGYGSWKYDQGYQAGIAQCSGGTCPTETGLINLDSGWSGYESYQPLGSGYFDEVIITDAGYGQAKFDQGYELGLATCSASSGSCLIEDEQTASLNYDWTGFTIVYPSQGYDGLGRVLVADLGYGQRKYDEGYAEGFSSQCDLVPLGVVVHAGDSGVINNITPDSAAGFSSVSVDARDYGAYLYTSGYNAGLYDCSATTCNLRPFDYQIYPSWDGYMSFSASQASLDGFSSVSIIDLGYGQAKYDQGFQSGYTSSPNRSKITFKVRNATEIQADLTFLSFSVNGVPVEDVGAIFQTEEIQSSNYTTLWISGYTQPSIITGVEITIKAENIYLNTFNYDWSLFTEINGAEYEAASRSQEFFDIIDDNNKSRRIIYTYTGIPLYNEYSFEAGKDYGIEVGKPIGYKEGMDSVIKSVLDENDTDLVIAYYYTSAYTNCLITGEYDFPQQDIHIDGNECISAMSINGGVWQTEQKYLHLQPGWTQIRFKVLNGGYRAMFSHAFTPSEECYMDALKVVSIPSGHCVGENMFRNNEGIRVLSTSCGVISCRGANNLNVVITHYTGSQRQLDYFPSSGVLFIPEGSTADWASILPNWTHIEMF